MVKRLIAVALAIMVAPCTLAVAAPRPAWVTPQALNVRKGPSIDSERIATLQRGQRVSVVAFRDDRWCKVVLSDGRVGWVKEEYLEFSASRARSLTSAPSNGSGSRVVPAWIEPPVVNMRQEPDVGSPVVVQLKQGEKVYVVARDGNWRKVKTGSGRYGWIRVDLLEFDVEKGRSLAVQGSRGGGEDPQPAWVSANVANVRSGPSEAFDRIGQVTKGTKVYILSRRQSWCRCKTPDGTGWIHSELLETDVAKGRALAASNGSESRDKAYCVGSQVNLRQTPSTSSDVLGQVREGDTLWIQEERNGWCRVETLDGKQGWIAGWYVRRHGARTTVASAPTERQLTASQRDFPPSTTAGSSGKLRPFRAWIAEDNTNVRYGPGLDRQVRFQLDKHTPVRVVDCEGQWCKIETESGNTGWAAGWVLDFQPPGEPEVTKVVDGQRVEAKVGWVSRPSVNVRAEASTEAQVVAQATLGTPVVITDQQGNWYKVVFGDGKAGWIASHLIETRAERTAAGSGPEESSSAREGSGIGYAIVREALSHLGKPYCRGASGPYTFDCSGFTAYVYSQFGISLPHTTTGQYLRGMPVSRDDLQPGDIVVFRNTYRSGISHVGLYIGEGRFIHASNSRGGVKISELDSAYYAARYAGARRVR